jgi:hypothetical protein
MTGISRADLCSNNASGSVAAIFPAEKTRNTCLDTDWFAVQTGMQDQYNMADLDAIAQRPAAYLAGTGLPQLGGGLVFLFGGSAILIQRLLPGTPLYRLALPWVGTLCGIAAMLAIAAIKRKVIFPRGGYVVPLGRPQRLLYFGLGLLIVIALWAFARAGPEHRIDLLESRLVWPGFAILFAFICLSAVRQQKSASTVYFGVYLACLAPLLWWLPVSTYEQGACLQVGAGGPLAAAGGGRLIRFFRANPIPPEPGNE